MKKKVCIIDSTLRDGEQAPGILFTHKEKLKIAEHLSNIGVDEIEAGTPAICEQERNTIREISRLNLNSDISVWCRAVEKDMWLASGCNVSRIHISFPVSDILLTAMGKNVKWIFESLKKLIFSAINNFDYISIGAIDAMRCDKNVLFDFIACAKSYGADRVRLADTIGTSTPLSIYKLVKEIKQRNREINIGFHGHNDLGMATANSMAAIEANADFIDVTVNGIGERSGNAPLEEVAFAIIFSNLHYCNIDTSQLKSICTNVSKITGRPIPVDNPITGENIFTHESGVHCRGILKNPLTFQPFLPERAGISGYKMVAGKHSGASALKKIFNDAGICISSKQAQILVKPVKNKAIEKRKSLSMGELKEIYNIHLGKFSSSNCSLPKL